MYPTLNELFNEAVAAHAEKIALRMLIPQERKRGRGIQLVLNEISYARLGEMASGLAAALNELGIKKGDKVALISKPRVAWATAFFAILKCGATVLPLDPELQEGEIERILVEAEVKGAIVSGLKVADLQAIREKKLHDIAIISMDRPDSDDVHFIDQLLLGKKAFTEVDVSPDDMAVLMYTSGTTGNAKGAMLLHRNIASNAITGAKVADSSERDNFLTIVPWYHIYGLTVALLVPILCGSTSTYAPVDRNLTTVMTKARPTILLGVPKLYNVLYSKVMTSIEGSLLKKSIYKLSPTLMGKLVSKKLFGKDFRYFASGGAPFSREVANGFRRMGIGVMEGYGLTETAPVLAMCERFTTEPGMVAYENVELRIDKPDASGIGEVVARGPNIMAGYYKNEAATAEVIDEEGWFHTGDLGRMEGDRLILSGRAKNVIVLETGKNVYPEEVEWELSRITGIEELLVYEADRQGAPVVAVKIYPKWADLKEKGITTPEQVIDYLWEEIKVHNENLAPFKRIKYRDAITLMDEPFEKSVKMDIKRYMYSKA